MTEPAALTDAYRAAIYTLDTSEGPHRLVVGEPNAVLNRLLAAAGVTTAARLTAANPGSLTELPAAVNDAANQCLRDDLARRGFRWLDCASAAPNGSWPEAGFLVLGIPRADTEALARAYGQRALLWCERGWPIELVML